MVQGLQDVVNPVLITIIEKHMPIPMEGFEEVKPLNVTFFKVDDYIKGTYVEKFVPQQPDQYGHLKPAYVIKVDEGELHNEDGTPRIIETDQNWRVWGGKPSIDNPFAQAQFGQKVIVHLAELRPSKLGQPAKIIKVLLGAMDPDFKKDAASTF